MAQKRNRDVLSRMPKKFMRSNEVAELYSLSKNKVVEMAREAGACYKLNQAVLINLEIFDQYLETFRI